MTSQEIRAQIIATDAQMCLIGDGTTDTMGVARQVRLTYAAAEKHVDILAKRGWVQYVESTPFHPRRWRFTALGAIMATVDGTIT